MNYDAIIIGAGPAGSMTAHYLRKHSQDMSILIIDKDEFPRFILGESLLPHCMDFFEEVNLLQPIIEAGYQHKNGAFFVQKEREIAIDFRTKQKERWGTTYQVKRDHFDHLLCQEAQKKNVDILYHHNVTDIQRDEKEKLTHLTIIDNKSGESKKVSTPFIFDASGFGALMAKDNDLEEKHPFPVRKTYFTHIYDNIDSTTYDRNKIIISIDDDNREIWAWLIPFSDGTSSLGFILPEGYQTEDDNEKMFQKLIQSHSHLKNLLKNHKVKADIQIMEGYSRKTKASYGDGFVLIGNTVAFLDPVFSSGVTIACQSAKLAAHAYKLQYLDHQQNDDIWKKYYEEPLFTGIHVFEKFVRSWYTTQLQEIIFSHKDNAESEIAYNIIDILAGYAWDEDNVFFTKAQKILDSIKPL